MTGLCQLCGVTVIGANLAELHAIDPESERGRVVDFDALAAHMWLHISDFHPDQMKEGILVQQRAAKMYALNWMRLDAQQTELRKEHRKSVLIAMTVTTQFNGDGDQAAAAEPASGDSSAPAPPEGSNEKKSVKNTSN